MGPYMRDPKIPNMLFVYSRIGSEYVTALNSRSTVNESIQGSWLAKFAFHFKNISKASFDQRCSMVVWPTLS